MTLKSITNPSEFRQQIMEPDYAEFAHEPTDLRLAFHAASSLFHLRDWVALTCGQTKNQLQSDLEGLCKSFGLITDIANSSKHLKLQEDRRRTDMTDVGDVQLRAIGVDGYGVGASGYGQAGAYGLVLAAIVVYPDGKLFAQAAQEVHQMWAEFFEKRGW